jgi:membrane associated rhomboid family serine protease
MIIKENIEKKRLFISAYIPLLYVLLIWMLHIVQHLFEFDLTHLGVYPQKIKGLVGILFSPLIHGSWEHLMSNSVPLLVLGTMLFYFYPKPAWKVFLLLYFVTGIWVWFGARQAFHIGSSGIVYGLASFVFTCGVILKSVSLLAVSLLVVFLYGSIIWGIFPINWSFSWESHLSGFVLGIILAIYYRQENKYLEQVPEWMNEPDDNNDEDNDWYEDENFNRRS